MICLLRVGFDEDEHADEALWAEGADRLGNYRIERRDDGTPWELGRGAMGVTYRAVDTSLERPVALKLIDSEWVKRGAEARERFMREARVAAALRHPNVATVYHFGIREENGQFFCAMELVEGETLEMRVRRTGPLDALTTVEIALQVTSALAAAEKQGLVHRDLKPANLMLVESQADASVAVKVIDFGVAKALSEKPDAMGLTRGGFVGTPAFASPEQFANAPVDVRSDIYSLGATVWYLLSGHMPFAGASVEEVRAHQKSQELPLEQLKAARVPHRLISLILSMLALEPAARPSVQLLTSQLQACRARLAARWKPGRRWALAAGLLVLASVGFVLLPRWQALKSQPQAPPILSEKSIAVLPFENLSPDPANTFFADGIQDEVLTSLAKIKDLKVISRTSVMSYRDKSKRNLREIAKELGVAHVLEGSVRRGGNRVLINVQLIDTRNDHHIWAERYDRTLSDSLTLQGELAAEIAVALRATLSPEEKSRLETKATNNPEAYVFYLRGREAQLRPEVSLENYLNAETFYKQAIALDPRFVLARARLSMMQVNIVGFFEPNNAARMAEARAHAQEALRLDPDCAEAHLAGAQTALPPNDQEIAKRELAMAIQLRPNDASVRMAAAMGQWNLGLVEESAANYKRAAELAPREAKVFYNYGILLRMTGKEAEARVALDRALVLAPESVFFRLQRADAEMCWTGDIQRVRAILAVLPPGQDPDGRVTSAYCTLALFERNYPEILRLLREYRLERLPSPPSNGFGEQLPKAYVEGMAALFSGDRSRAWELFDSIRSEWEDDVRARPESPGDRGGLALIYAWMGWKEAALAEAACLIDLETAAATPPDQRSSFILGLIYAWVGELDLAFAQLEQHPALLSPAYTIHKFRLDPSWDPLRNDPRFQKLLASLDPK